MLDFLTGLSPQRKSHAKLPYSDGVLGRDLARIREVWRESRRQHDRFSVYQYLSAVFNLVMVWKGENRAVDRATRALRLKGRPVGNIVEPFAAVIHCTSSRRVADAKARSKWSRVLIFAARYKRYDEQLDDFIRGHGGINACVAKLSRLGRNGPKRTEI